MLVKVIAAVNNKGYIWKDNALMWTNKYEMAFFKKTTLNHTVVMWRKTFQSIWHPLPQRNNVIITRTTSWMHDATWELLYDLHDVTAVDSLKKSLQMLIVWALWSHPPHTVFIIGGGTLYQEAVSWGFADEIILSIVDNDDEGDVSFPPINPEMYQIYKTDYSNKIYWFYNVYYKRVWQ